jgi:enterochelin esterase family protein
LNGRVVVERVQSELLKNNPLGDPFVRDLYLYLPPSYGQGSQQYPSVLCLSGFTGSARSWFNFQAWIPSIDERMDGLIAGGMPEMILIFPDCFTRYGGSQFLDSPAVGAYRSHLLQEILPLVDRKYRTKPAPRYRGVMGKSSGGYGAITLAMEHPDLFSAVACHSGDMYFEYVYTQEFPVAFRKLNQMGGLKAFFEKFDELPKSGKEDHALVDTIAMSACYSPNPQNSPHLFDLPFEEESGELRPEIWKKWKEKDPIEIVKKTGIDLKTFGVVYLDCGRKDEFYLDIGTRLFCAELTRAGVAHQHEEFDGGHFNVQFRYDVSLRKFAEYFR